MVKHAIDLEVHRGELPSYNSKLRDVESLLRSVGLDKPADEIAAVGELGVSSEDAEEHCAYLLTTSSTLSGLQSRLDAVGLEKVAKRLAEVAYYLGSARYDILDAVKMKAA